MKLNAREIMKKLIDNLFIGNQTDYEHQVKHEKNWAVIHACKEPYHRKLLSYTGRSAPKDHPEYLFAQRSLRLYLNLIDAPSFKYIPKEIIDKALDFITKNINERPVLVHCNLGMSRSATIGILYLASIGHFKGRDYYKAEQKYKKLYPKYNPGRGMRGFAIENWKRYYKET